MDLNKELIFGFISLLIAIFGVILMLQVHEGFILMVVIGFMTSGAFAVISQEYETSNTIPDGSEFEIIKNEFDELRSKK